MEWRRIQLSSICITSKSWVFCPQHYLSIPQFTFPYCSVLVVNVTWHEFWLTCADSDHTGLPCYRLKQVLCLEEGCQFHSSSVQRAEFFQIREKHSGPMMLAHHWPRSMWDLLFKLAHGGWGAFLHDYNNAVNKTDMAQRRRHRERRHFRADRCSERS